MLVAPSASVVYARAGLSLSHYDAKAHLVVAAAHPRQHHARLGADRRGVAAAAPRPELLPVQIDGFYRTGASAIAFSVLSLGVSRCVHGSHRRSG